MTFILTVAEIDAIAATADRPTATHMGTPFSKAATENGIAEERREALQFIATVLRLGMYFHPSSSSQPFGKFGGSHTLEQFTPEQAQTLAALAPEIQTPEIRAIFADIAWMRIRGNVDVARLAVAAYLDSARLLEDPDEWTYCADRAERAIRLSRSLGVEDSSFQPCADYLSEIVTKYQGNDPRFLTGKVIELLLEFEIGDPASYVVYARQSADGAMTRNNFYVARFMFDVLAKLHRTLGDQDAAVNDMRDSAKTFEAEARQKEAAGENLAAAHYFNMAIQAHRRAPGNAPFVEALRPELQRVERASIGELKRITTEPINISQYTLASRKHVSGHDLRTAVLRFAHVVPLPSPDEIRKTVVEIGKLAPLHRMMSMSALDGEGRTIGLTPGESSAEKVKEEAIFAQIVAHLSQQYMFDVPARILPAFDQISLEHPITLLEMLDLSAYSPFVPSGRQRTFAEGLYAGFNGDFLTANHLLVPQIENSIRHLLDERGHVTTKIDKAGIQRVQDLNDLVVDARVETVLSKAAILQLRALFTDNRGPNLRNQLAHGMLPDGAFMSPPTIYAWWFILALCMFSPVVRPPQDEAPAPETS